MMVNEHLEKYMAQLMPVSDPILLEMETRADRENIPIIQRSSIHLIRSIILAKGDMKNVLEIGTAIGYSAIWLARAAACAHIDTMEKDPLRVQQASEYIRRAQLQDRITIHEGDARELIPIMEKEYDLIFIDAAKGQYRTFFEQAFSLLQPNGVVISDNVFFQGKVLETDKNIEPKRLQSMVHKIREYNHWLSHHPHCETTFVPVGDGLAISTRV